MTVEDIRRVLTEHRQELSTLGVKDLAVFGSVARGEAHAGSDIDVLVNFEGKATFDGYMGLKFMLEDVLGCGVDLVTRKALKPLLRPAIEREAVNVS